MDTAPGGFVVDGEMAKMHLWGEMQEYVMKGSCTIDVEWKVNRPETVTYTPCE